MNNTVAVFDIGKTNKKLLLFDDRGEVVFEQTEQLLETKDDDGFPCEDILVLKNWLLYNWKKILSDSRFEITSVNFTSYGASLVHLDESDEPVTPLYSYLKPFPDSLKKEFYERYGDEASIALETASPSMGMLNSGLQLYWLKNIKPRYFRKIKTTLHLPQYLSFLVTGKKNTEFTSIGCHTAIWNFEKNDYHSWIYQEGFDVLFPRLISQPLQQKMNMEGKQLTAGSGLHDSSSSLLPFSEKYTEPFILLSTGTWCINLNPFNKSPLTLKELSSDCLCYFTPYGEKVKASRVFIGREHEFQIQRIAKHFAVSENFYSSIRFENSILEKLIHEPDARKTLLPSCMEGMGPFPFPSAKPWDLSIFSSAEEAYYQLMLDLSCMVLHSTRLIDSEPVKKVFIEGGFVDNDLFVNLMANHFKDKEVLISHLPQGTALGAAIEIGLKTNVITWKSRRINPSSCYRKLQEYTATGLKLYGEFLR